MDGCGAVPDGLESFVLAFLAFCAELVGRVSAFSAASAFLSSFASFFYLDLAFFAGISTSRALLPTVLPSPSGDWLFCF